MKGGVLIVCGGTGGHVYPAIAVAEKLRSEYKLENLSFIGKKDGFEEKVIESEGFEFNGIKMSGMQRGKIVTNIKLLLLIPMTIFTSCILIIKRRPEIIFGTGGYVSLPVLAAGLILQKKIILQEQNSYPGITIRFFSRFSKVVYLGFSEASKYLPKGVKLVNSGNPLREESRSVTSDIKVENSISDNQMVLFVFGGSQGSVPINRIILNVLNNLMNKNDIVLLWQTGEKDFDYINEKTKEYNNVKVFSYINNIYDFYKVANLVISRSGAMTITELANFGLPAIFIPLPSSAEDHQRYNAKMVEKAGGGICLDQQGAENNIEDKIGDILSDSNRLKLMGENIKQFNKKDATTVIASGIVEEMEAK